MVSASDLVSILARGTRAQISGGRVTRIEINNARDWCAYYGVPVGDDGVAVLFKAVRHDFRSAHNFAYTPGTLPEAHDWDGGKQECGFGLHFSPCPSMALAFDGEATRFVGCPVKVDELAVHHDGDYPEKVKGQRCCAPTFEVDRFGKTIAAPASTGQGS